MPLYKSYLVNLQRVLLIFIMLTPVIAKAGAFEQLFAPASDLWPVWQARDDSSQLHVNHDRWEQFLKKNVQQGSDGINRINYAAVSKLDRNNLQAYLAEMQVINISEYNGNQQLAYWINLYNAVTVEVVLEHYPVKSIRDIDISPGFFSDGPWGKLLIKVEGRELSLNDIEHRILRPVWKDARIHYAVNCASLACPNLRRHAFQAATLTEQLDLAAREYIAHPRGMRFTDEGVIVSSIYSWFQKDFGEQEADVIKHLQKYASDEKANKLKGMKFFAGDEYDWSLNDLTE